MVFFFISLFYDSEILKAQKEIRNQFPETLLNGLKSRQQKKKLFKNYNHTTTSHNDNDDLKILQQQQQQPRISSLESASSARGIADQNKGELLPVAVNDAPHNETELDALMQASVYTIKLIILLLVILWNMVVGISIISLFYHTSSLILCFRFFSLTHSLT